MLRNNALFFLIKSYTEERSPSTHRLRGRIHTLCSNLKGSDPDPRVVVTITCYSCSLEHICHANVCIGENRTKADIHYENWRSYSIYMLPVLLGTAQIFQQTLSHT